MEDIWSIILKFTQVKTIFTLFEVSNKSISAAVSGCNKNLIDEYLKCEYTQRLYITSDYKKMITFKKNGLPHILKACLAEIMCDHLKFYNILYKILDPNNNIRFRSYKIARVIYDAINKFQGKKQEILFLMYNKCGWYNPYIAKYIDYNNPVNNHSIKFLPFIIKNYWFTDRDACINCINRIFICNNKRILLSILSDISHNGAISYKQYVEKLTGIKHTNNGSNRITIPNYKFYSKAIYYKDVSLRPPKGHYMKYLNDLKQSCLNKNISDFSKCIIPKKVYREYANEISTKKFLLYIHMSNYGVIKNAPKELLVRVINNYKNIKIDRLTQEEIDHAFYGMWIYSHNSPYLKKLITKDIASQLLKYMYNVNKYYYTKIASLVPKSEHVKVYISCIDNKLYYGMLRSGYDREKIIIQ